MEMVIIKIIKNNKELMVRIRLWAWVGSRVIRNSCPQVVVLFKRNIKGERGLYSGFQCGTGMV